MRQYDANNLIIHPGNSHDSEVVVEVTPELAGWEYISFQLRRLPAGRSWTFSTGGYEMAIVVLSGRIGVESDRGQWLHVGKRDSVFNGLPYALYLPWHTSLTVEAETACEYAVALAGGNWSSYPPHKHDIHKTDQAGKIVEADLEEVYFYKLDRPEGFAFQRIYTAPESPLHKAGFPIDVVLLTRNNDIVLVPEGYHPVNSAPGYTTYYLNVLAGSAQSLANSEDQRYAWVKEHYRSRDPRVPIYDVEQRL
jgi:5-deoxy-glucuronate isomerase